MRNVTARTVLLSVVSTGTGSYTGLMRLRASESDRPDTRAFTIDVSILGLGPATKPTCYLIVS